MKLTKEQLIECFKPFFKQQGFKKIRTTWKKTTDDIIFILNIQGSQWSKEDYYINVSINIRALGDEQDPNSIFDRIDEREKKCSDICEEIKEWFEMYGEIQKLKLLHQQNKLPLVTTLITKEYLEEI